MYMQLQRFLATLPLFSLFLQSCGNPNMKMVEPLDTAVDGKLPRPEPAVPQQPTDLGYVAVEENRGRITSFEHVGQLLRDMHEVGHGDVSLETARLMLRKPHERDAASLFEHASNENVSRYTSWEAHRRLGDSIDFITRSTASFGKGYDVGPFVILNKEAPDTVIGTVGCFEVSRTDRCMEFGVAISEEHWRKGVATEVGREVMNYAFSHFDVARLQFRCTPEHSASLALAKRLGFREEGILRNVVWCKGRFWSMHYLSMLREDWNRSTTE